MTTTLSQLASTDLEFPKLMAKLRLRSGMSARALSTAAGVSVSYVNKMEHGEFLPSVDTFARLVRELDCSDAEVAFLIRALHG